jgi:hypothetical protein
VLVYLLTRQVLRAGKGLETTPDHSVFIDKEYARFTAESENVPVAPIVPDADWLADKDQTTWTDDGGDLVMLGVWCGVACRWTLEELHLNDRTLTGA